MDPIQSWLDAKEVRRMAESLMAPSPEVDTASVEAGYGDRFEGFADAAAPDTGGADAQQEALNRPGQQAQAQHEALGSALAAARQVAEGSGMLVDRDVAGKGQSAEMAASPFEVSEHQGAHEEIPMARAVEVPVVRSEEAASEPPVFGRGMQQQASGGGGSRGPFLERLQAFSNDARSGFGAQAMFLIDNDGQVIVDEVGNPKLIQMARTLANASSAALRQSTGPAAVGNLHVKIGANATLEVLPVQSRYGLLVLGAIFPEPLGIQRVGELTALLERAVEPTEK